MQTSLWNRAAVCAAVGALGLGLGASQPVAAMTAEEAFADGNRLFRDDLYWAALLRYEQAAAAGYDSPLLNYNVGVAHYQARQYRRAGAAFEKAAAEPRLNRLARYNQALSAYAAGDRAEALRRFVTLRDESGKDTIGSLADSAIDKIRRDVLLVQLDEQPESDDAASEAPVRDIERDPRPFSNIEVYASVGFGNDSNVYRTPGQSYLDINDPDLPVFVEPVVQSGSFVPVSLGAKYLVNSFEHESFFARYRGRGHFYSGEELTNANEYSQELALGTEFRKDRENRQNRVFSAFTVAQHEETFFDPDDGSERIVDDVNIGERYSYLRYGPELSTRQSWERISMRFWGKAQIWNYERTDTVPEYDHDFFRLGSSLQYRFTSTSLLRLTAEGYVRNFSDRPSFALDGTQEVTNPGVEYYYIDVGATARQRITGNFWFGVNYTYTTRMDQYVGYNDYLRDSFGAQAHLSLGQNFELDLNATYRLYNFENAFAFNNPAAERKTLEAVDAQVRMSYALPWDLRLIGDVRIRDVDSNDTRIIFERNQFMLSLEWSLD